MSRPRPERARPTPFEVHTHSYLRGPNANRADRSTLTHSHANGSAPHQHPDTGPAAYTIDKDAWAAATGMIGGGRKQYTAEPSGPQMERVELEAWQRSFTVIVTESAAVEAAKTNSTGPGLAPAARMVLQFGMTVKVIDAPGEVAP